MKLLERFSGGLSFEITTGHPMGTTLIKCGGLRPQSRLFTSEDMLA